MTTRVVTAEQDGAARAKCAVRVNGPALVRWIRESRGYTQEDIAVLCGMQPQSRTLVSMWETGAREPTYWHWRVLVQLVPHSSVSFLEVSGELPEAPE